MAEAGMVYQFKSSARIPKGVTPEGIMAERDRIEHDYGKATIGNSVEAVLADPGKYPNLRAFAPATQREAMRQAIEQGIRYAYRMVTVQRVTPAGKTEARQIRVIHSVRDDEGELTYKPIQVIRQSPGEVKYLIAQLQKDADDYANKMRDVLAEIAEVL
jgi:hypothetical protein